MTTTKMEMRMNHCPMKPTFADTEGTNTLNVVMPGFRLS